MTQVTKTTIPLMPAAAPIMIGNRSRPPSPPPPSSDSVVEGLGEGFPGLVTGHGPGAAAVVLTQLVGLLPSSLEALLTETVAINE